MPAWALYTDGSSDSRDKSGGWAWIAFDAHGDEISDSGGTIGTTNNRMEMLAWIEGLQSLLLFHGPCYVIVYSDSQYVGLGAMDRGRNRNKNADLWSALDTVIDDHVYVQFCHVKGHKEDVMNHLVDKMASEARKSFRQEHIDKEREALASNDGAYTGTTS